MSLIMNAVKLAANETNTNTTNLMLVVSTLESALLRIRDMREDDPHFASRAKAAADEVIKISLQTLE